MTNPEAHAGWMLMDGRPRGAGELPLPRSSPCTCLSLQLPYSEEDIIVVHKRAGQ